MKKNKKIQAEGRTPVVVVLGHVDHGKSSLLEAVKDFKITDREAGGITQHIGAYQVEHQGKNITFIDTPGHEAFFAMRSRGTKVADIGILVVAADESVKEQTKEAINHLKEAEMPFLVAINKIDKENTDIERVKLDLSKEEIYLESYGGSIPSVNVSAKKKEGIEELLEMILLMAEMEDLKKEESGEAQGVVIETRRDDKKGVVATLLVKKGNLKIGEVVATKSSFGKVRGMEDFRGENINTAPPSTPVQVTGLKGCPEAGEDFFVFQKADEAKRFVLVGEEKCPALSVEERDKALNIVLKVDVGGSLEAIKMMIDKIPQEEINIKIVKEGIGNINDSDIDCVKSAQAEVFGFKVKTEKGTEKTIIRDKIEVKSYQVIYELVEEVRRCAEEMLGEELVREVTGKVKVLAVFKTQKNRQILGGKITEGEVKQGDLVEIEGKGEGKLVNIKKEEKDMKKIKAGEEFGMLLESNKEVEEGDYLIAYKEEKRKKKL